MLKEAFFMEDRENQMRGILLALSKKEKGDWPSIYSDIRNKEPVSQKELEEAYQKTASKFVTLIDEDYPSGLKQLDKPPFLLYYYGNFSLLREKYRLTVVGTRAPTLYQNNTTYEFVKSLEEKTENRTVIISGMAKGIDSSAMTAAMEMKAPVVAVLGSGIDAPYPKNNSGIYDYCKSGNGLVLSEYPLKTQALPDHFVFRNRILAALSMVVFVGGGRRYSGTTATVRHALDLNDDILALPCNVTGADLTNELIRDGAGSVLSPEDLHEALKSRYDSLK